jgi:hypothetical protein
MTRCSPCLLSVGFILSTAVSLPAADDAQGPISLPGGVTDTSGKVGYLSKPKGGMVAIDLEKGKILWETKEASRPLVVSGKRLVALAADEKKPNNCRVLVLDTEARGKQLLKSDAMTLPNWAAIGTGLDRPTSFGYGRLEGFQVRSHLAKDTLIVRWWADEWSGGGARPPRRTNYAAGVARIHLNTGKVEMKRDDKMEAPTGTGLAEIQKLPKNIQEVAQRERWQAGVVVGQRAYGAVRRPASRLFGRVKEFVQAVEIKTGKRLWERQYDEYEIFAPPP